MGGASYRGMGHVLMKVASVLLLAVAIVSAIAWSQTRALLSAGSSIETKAQSYVLVMNKTVEDFKGDPSSASSATPILSMSRDGFASLGERLAMLPSPPGSDGYTGALDAYLKETGEYYGKLADTSDFVIERSKMLAQVLYAIQNVATDGTGDVVELRKRVTIAEDSAGNTATKMRSLDASTSAAYSAQALSEWLETLRGSLRTLGTGLAKRDLVAVSNASRQVGALMKSDLDGLFYEADSAGLARLDQQRARVGRAAVAVARERRDASQQQRAYGFIALTAAISAAVLAAGAWLR